jgi:fatty acid desaturase
VGDDPQTTGTGQPAPRRVPDPLALVAGLAALAVAVTALVGSTSWFPPLDGRWILAGGAMAVGVALLVGSLCCRS